MPAWLIPLLIQLAPIVLSAVAPLVTALTQKLAGWFGTKVPAGLNPVVNGLAGAVLAGLVGGNPVAGALTAHVVRSGLVHEPPAP